MESGTVHTILVLGFCLFLAREPAVGQGLPIHVISRSHTTTHHSRQDSSGRVISSSQVLGLRILLKPQMLTILSNVHY